MPTVKRSNLKLKLKKWRERRNARGLKNKRRTKSTSTVKIKWRQVVPKLVNSAHFRQPHLCNMECGKVVNYLLVKLYEFVSHK